jgi:hypothetical protein
MSNTENVHQDRNIGKDEASKSILAAAIRAAEANRCLLRACSVLLSHRDCERLRKIGSSFQGVVEPLTRIARALEREAEAVSDVSAAERRLV